MSLRRKGQIKKLLKLVKYLPKKLKSTKVKNGLKKILFLTLIFHIIFVLVIAGFLFVYKFKDPACTTLMLYRAGFDCKKKSYKLNVKLDHVPSLTKRMILIAEDPGFYHHFGVEPKYIMRAFQRNLKLRRKAYGGSTITQQLARTLFLIPVKSYFRKYLELIITLETELILSKNRILELYCNNIEIGKNIYGLAAGAWYYYQTPISQLNKDQQMRLITIVASPIKNHPYAFQKSYQLTHRYKLLNTYF
ncbi:MAG: transglycosylase domain-containing protein [Spirochaetes bacterium]|nr:transglycosylase domain-containing protein [Spirochaetota bacterium]